MNPADHRFEDRLYKRITTLEQQMQDIKTSQRMGLDNFVYKFSDIFSTSVFLGSGESHTLRVNFYAPPPALFVSELSLAFFMNNDLDPAYHWPDGSGLDIPTTGLLPFSHYEHYDLSSSDELGAGLKVYYIYLVNDGGNSKTIHLHGSLLFPTGNVT